uniref:Uncharacterized protein n=1 Tax=Lepeophtheirus salmonis TaxID=72036 RepID=A0A0K2U8I6_LEPSM
MIGSPCFLVDDNVKEVPSSESVSLVTKDCFSQTTKSSHPLGSVSFKIIRI